MIPLPREMLVAHMRDHQHLPVTCDQYPVQLGLPDAWRVAAGSIIVERVGDRIARLSLKHFFARHQEPGTVLDVFGVTQLLSRSPLRSRKARNLVAMSQQWITDTWHDLRELPGCGLYVCDAVGLFCFGCKELAGKDKHLHDYL